MKRIVVFCLAAIAAVYLLAAAPSVAEGLTGCCKKPLVQTAAYETAANESAIAPVQVLRVYFIAVAYNVETGEIIGGISAKFPTMAACKAVQAAPLGTYIPAPPPGHRVYVECKNPSDVAT